MADKFHVEVVPIKMPDFQLDKRAYEEIAAVVEAGILTNLKDQKQVDGSPLKSNPPEYKAAKEAAGFGGLSLVRKDHSLARSRKGGSTIGGSKGSARSTFQSNANVFSRTVSVELSPGKAYDRGVGVQEKGYAGWMGVSKKTVGLIGLVIKKFIKRAVAKAKRAQGL